ncbi:MAG: glutathione S-transferase family protein [Alphaproteobacteria bacterium]|jgi:glutathione S-transferase|nr:glutathione S-transferase family protein [Alphaproteobacteria bacterium]MDP6591469.1 glutathione S-transferase family protein [Alphaproteobacteria bacterium]MDP6818197.1 glutathione S-transferase family protein [Alphaproteobacteria bacterium]|tara:strand:+ start:406 stop:1098 length:693 start_codon:yes stop_codon:yes gene_type:complete
MSEVEIFSAEVCPFAQRTRMVLIEKGVEFTLREVDLAAKPDWFIEVSPYSKVPVIRHRGRTVYESAIINEYLDEVYPTPPMMPSEPGARASARIWIDFMNIKLLPCFYRLLMTQEPDKQAAEAATLKAHFRLMEAAMAGEGAGPYWFGGQLGLVDLALYPWFERLPALEHYRGAMLPEDCARLGSWFTAMEQTESARATTNGAEYHIAAYVKYADNSTDSISAREFRASA